MLTSPLVSLSKPIGPFNELGVQLRTVSELNPAFGGNLILSMIFFKEQLLKRFAKLAKIQLLIHIHD